MANDKRGHAPEPDVTEVLDELAVDDSTDFLAGPTARNEAGDTKRAAAKATGAMGASRKIDPDLMVDPHGDRVKSGSSAGIHGFHDLPEDASEPARMSLSNEEVAESVPTTARKSPAQRSPRTDATAGESPSGSVRDRRRVPAPGTVVDVPKGVLVRGQSGHGESSKG